MRSQLDDGSAYAAAGIPEDQRGLDFVRPDGTRTVFQSANVARIRRYDDTGKAVEESLVPNAAVAGAGEYAFGSFRSPSWLTKDREIPATPTRWRRPEGHGLRGDRLHADRAVRRQARGRLARGDLRAGHHALEVRPLPGRRPQRRARAWRRWRSTRSAMPSARAARRPWTPSCRPGPVRFSGFGRGRDLNGDGTITDQEGVQTPGQPNPLASIGLRDGLRQTALDNMALVRAIGRGVDVDGDGSEDLRRDGVVYYAQSLGGIYGTMLMGVDQRVRAGALNVPGGPILDIARQSPAFREVVAAELKNRKPGLLNGGREGFTESTPLFLDPPVTKPARGALPIQDVGASVDWLNRSGSPETFAPLLRRSPLGGVGAKKVLFQFAYGDQTVPTRRARR
jgi:hypothetical protein